MSKEQFEQRMELLRRMKASVLPLEEAVVRLFANDLPERAVVLSFDDGTADFVSRAYPILKAYGFPATVYLTTYYSCFNRPVFSVACSYMLWKCRGGIHDVDGIIVGTNTLDLRTEASRSNELERILRFAENQRLSGEEKDRLLTRLGEALAFDRTVFSAKRLLHVMNGQEIREVSAGGIDIQLHTHRHRMPVDRTLFALEVEQNRRVISSMTGKEPTHFCYPSGVYGPQFLPWLEELGVMSATTCDTGLASARSHSLLMPRLLDVPSMSMGEFEGWIAGTSCFLPRRPRNSSIGTPSSTAPGNASPTRIPSVRTYLPG